MTRLPVEILHEIFLQLHQHDKLTCMTVCKHWKFVIEKHSLCRTVRLTRAAKLNMLLKQLKRDPIQAQTLERLILDFQHENKINFTTIIQTFPNVRSLTTFQSCDRKIPVDGQCTWGNIKQIEEYYSCSLTAYLLKQQTCTHLTKIIIGRVTNQYGRKMIKLFANAPSLKYLTLISATLTLQDFESLHTNTPLLKSLELCGGVIQSNTLPTQVSPAPSLTTLNIKLATVSDTLSQMKLLKYLGAKYPNIDELAYEVIKSIRLIVGTQEHSEYKKQLAEFINGIGPKLTRLSFRLNDERVGIFQMLDDANCKMKKIKLSGSVWKYDMMELSSSQQAQYVQQLLVSDLGEKFPFTCLGTFTALEYLSTSYQKYGNYRHDKLYHFSELLQNANAPLKSLVVSKADVIFPHSYLLQGHSLCSLTFTDCKIPSHLDSFISHTFPHLRTLVFDSCKFDDKSLVFPETNLDYFKLVCRLSKSLNNVQVISLTGNERRRYSSNPCYFNVSVDKDDPFIYPALISQPDNLAFDPYMTFVFNSVRNCFVMNSIY